MEDVPRVVALLESEVGTKGEVHDMLAGELGFPEHYGRNLDALTDCLSEVSMPTLVKVVRARFLEEPDELPLSRWFDSVCLCLMRAARENPLLDVRISFE